jgi:hypothetical protein
MKKRPSLKLLIHAMFVSASLLCLFSCEEELIAPTKGDEGSKSTTVDYADADEEVPVP